MHVLPGTAELAGTRRCHDSTSWLMLTSRFRPSVSRPTQEVQFKVRNASVGAPPGLLASALLRPPPSAAVQLPRARGIGEVFAGGETASLSHYGSALEVPPPVGWSTPLKALRPTKT